MGSSQSSEQDKVREFDKRIEEENSKVDSERELSNQSDAKCKSSDNILTIEQIQLRENIKKRGISILLTNEIKPCFNEKRSRCK